MTGEQITFFSEIDKLGSGGRAALRREVGNLLRNADGKAITAFYRCLPSGVELWQEDRWFAVACLRCLWDEGPEEGKPLEQIIAAGELSDSTKHRVELLLDTKWDADGYLLIKLTRLIKLIRQKTERDRIDFAALLDDLIRWNGESQIVQRRWARTVFSTVYINSDEQKEN